VFDWHKLDFNDGAGYGAWLSAQVPLLLWVAAVIIIFGVSFQKLQGLQGPLASLNAAAHVRFRFAR
jgi:hypothetical protein